MPRTNPTLAGLALLLLVGCANRHAIKGQVVDRNGRPMERAIVALEPGGVELITDAEGRFTIDYLRDDEGERVRLDKRTDYTLEVFRTGYHVARSDFYYKKGELVVETITMTEDTIRVAPGEESIDPALYPDATQSTGATYEGE